MDEAALAGAYRWVLAVGAPRSCQARRPGDEARSMAASLSGQTRLACTSTRPENGKKSANERTFRNFEGSLSSVEVVLCSLFSDV